MKVDIWSDVRCPFCYIGKHKFEKALESFPQKDKIEVNWHSFELDPNLVTDPTINAQQHLADVKGISLEQVKEMSQHVVNAAAEIGLKFNSEKSVVANSFNAHRLIQLAKAKGLANEMEEKLFEAHFVEGKNIDDKDTLKGIAKEAGLKEEDVNKVLSSEIYGDDVRRDQMRASALGINGVPFFIFNDKWAVSGAQSPAVFSQALDKSWQEYAAAQAPKPVIINEGATCDVAGNCD